MKRVMGMEMHELLQKDPEIWDLFCRKEEYTSSLRDTNNRFPYYASQYRTIFEPKASEFLMEKGYQVEYPDGKPFAVCLTHDIDGIYSSHASKRSDAIKKLLHGKFSASFQSVKQLRSKKIPYVNFEEIMKLEERYNAHSSFYFLALDPHDPDYRDSYDCKDLESEIGSIKDRGWEVGLHCGRRGSVDLNELKNEKKRLENLLNHSVKGCRNHYLNFVVPETWELLSKAGLAYDCTFGYADCAGFRNGMCHPFRPFNLNTGKIIDIIEIPLVVMDNSLSFKYMRLDPDTSWEITRRLIDAVAECHGVITLLWHNTTLVDDQPEFYEKILHYCAEKNAWMTSGEDIVTWVNKNNR
jgi:peptidoglycan/xylan/chitin deacetylase (PgdA/CDA1 family)